MSDQAPQLNDDANHPEKSITNHENVKKSPDFYRIKFHGSYKAYLGLSLYNLLLTVLTLGLYYPYGRCAVRKFMYQETELAGSRFEWHGTGKEMFKGFIKAYAIFGVLFLTLQFGPYFIPLHIFFWVAIICYILIICLVPVAIHGMLRYRSSRSSYRGIHFGYRGQLKPFFKKTALDGVLSVISFGIYAAWLQVNIRKYAVGNLRFGNLKAKFRASGGDFLALAIVNGLLCVVTLYIYIPWAIVRVFKFWVENIIIIQDENKFKLRSDAKGGQYFWVAIKGILLTVVTLGIAGPIAKLMVQKYLMESIHINDKLDLDSVIQTEDSYSDATGDDMMDILDFDF